MIMAKLTNAQLIKELNYELSGEMQAIIQYIQHHFLAKGLLREPIADRFEENSKDEMKHMEELGERIVALGGIPTVEPRPVKSTKTLTGMIKLDLEGETEALKEYAALRDKCEEMGEVGTALILENILVDEQHHHDALLLLLEKEK